MSLAGSFLLESFKYSAQNFYILTFELNTGFLTFLKVTVNCNKAFFLLSLVSLKFYYEISVFDYVKVATDSEGNSKGYAFVHFETEDSAIQAIEKVNGMLLEKKKV